MTETPPLRRWQAGLIGLYLLVQLLVPLRHYFYPGPARWREEAARFSWRMMAHHKVAFAWFDVTDRRTGATKRLSGMGYLTYPQYMFMSGNPDLILQFSHFLRDEANRRGANVEVRAAASVMLNSRPPTLLVDPTVDLGAIERSWKPARWIVPLTEPLPPPDVQRRRAHDYDIPRPRTVFLSHRSEPDALASQIGRLQGLPGIEILHLNNSPIDDADLMLLESLPSIRVLNLAGTNVTDAGLEHLRAIPNLWIVNLQNTPVTDAGVRGLRRTMPRLRINH